MSIHILHLQVNEFFFCEEETPKGNKQGITPCDFCVWLIRNIHNVWPESSAELLCTFQFRIGDLPGVIKSVSGILFKYNILLFAYKLTVLPGSFVS